MGKLEYMMKRSNIFRKKTVINLLIAASAVIAALLSLSPGPRAQGSNVIRVAMLEPVGNATAMQKAMIRGALTEAITNEKGYEALTRTEIDRLMEEYKFQESGMVSDAGRKELGRMSAAELLCITRLTREKDDFFVESSLIDIESGRMVKTATELIESTSAVRLREGSVQLAARLVRQGIETFTANRIKVAMLEPVGNATAMQKAMIRGALAEAITNEKGYEALTRTEIDRLMEEYKFQESGIVSDAGRKELGRMSAAELLCITRLTRQMDDFFVESLDFTLLGTHY